MITDDIKKIENELNIRLNEAYKKVLLNNPFSDKEKYSYVYESILDDADELIRINGELKANGLQGKPWFKNAFVIGTNGTDNYYFIILSEDENNNIYMITDEDKFNPKNPKKYLKDLSYEDFIDMSMFMQDLIKREKDEIERNQDLNK